jgi:hypothetical protein
MNWIDKLLYLPGLKQRPILVKLENHEVKLCERQVDFNAPFLIKNEEGNFRKFYITHWMDIPI